MNDVVRELGGTLGVAVVGSLLTSGYGSGMHGAVAGLPTEAAEAASDSVGGAYEVAAQLSGGAGAKLTDVANTAFVDAMATTSTLAAAAAMIGALVALAFLPPEDASRPWPPTAPSCSSPSPPDPNQPDRHGPGTHGARA